VPQDLQTAKAVLQATQALMGCSLVSKLRHLTFANSTGVWGQRHLSGRGVWLGDYVMGDAPSRSGVACLDVWGFPPSCLKVISAHALEMNAGLNVRRRLLLSNVSHD
jgi:hypothetical protein